MKLAATILALALLTGCHQAEQLIKPPYNDQQIAWGQVINGLQVGLAVREYNLGLAPERDMAYYSVHLRNSTRQAIKVLMPAKPKFGMAELPLAGDESVKVTLRYVNHPKIRAAEFKPPNRPFIVQLDSGEETSFEIRMTPGKFGLKTMLPGELVATYSNAQATIDYGSSGAGPVGGVWTGSADSSPLKVAVASTQPAP